jgi:hypothetical protein
MTGLEKTIYTNPQISHIGFTETFSLPKNRETRSTLEQLAQEVQQAYPQGAAVRITAKDVFVCPKGSANYQEFIPQNAVLNGALKKSLNTKTDFLKATIANTNTLSTTDVFTDEKLNYIKKSTVVTQATGIVGKTFSYLGKSESLVHGLKGVGILSALRNGLATIDGLREYENISKTGDAARVKAKLFSVLFTAVSTGDSANSVGLGAAKLSGTIAPIIVLKVAAATTFIGSILLMGLSTYTFIHEFLFSYRLWKAKNNGLSKEKQAEEIWKFFEKRLEIDEKTISENVYANNKYKTAHRLRKEVSVMHKRLIPFSFKFDAKEKKELFQTMESNLDSILNEATNGLSGDVKEKIQKEFLNNYMILIEAEFSKRRKEGRLKVHAGSNFIQAFMNHPELYKTEQGSEKILKAYELMQKESCFKQGVTVSLATAAMLSLTAAVLALLLVFCPGLVPQLAIDILGYGSGSIFIAYGLVTIARKLYFETYEQDVKELFHSERPIEIKKKIKPNPPVGEV